MYKNIYFIHEVHIRIYKHETLIGLGFRKSGAAILVVNNNILIIINLELPTPPAGSKPLLASNF